jgi:hypothetical protein
MEGDILFIVARLSEIENPGVLAQFEAILFQLERYCSLDSSAAVLNPFKSQPFDPLLSAASSLVPTFYNIEEGFFELPDHSEIKQGTLAPTTGSKEPEVEESLGSDSAAGSGGWPLFSIFSIEEKIESNAKEKEENEGDTGSEFGIDEREPLLSSEERGERKTTTEIKKPYEKKPLAAKSIDGSSRSDEENPSEIEVRDPSDIEKRDARIPRKNEDISRSKERDSTDSPRYLSNISLFDDDMGLPYPSSSASFDPNSDSGVTYSATSGSVGISSDAHRLSSLYYALKKVYEHLTQAADGYKHFSLPELNQYLEQLTEIEADRRLTVSDQVLWETLNPRDGFRAEQLLPREEGGDDILSLAIERHKEDYLPDFSSKLKDINGIYEPAGKKHYFERKADNHIHLMLRDGESLSIEEYREAVREHKVICQDMNGGFDVNICIHDHKFTRENTEQTAIIVTRLGLNLVDERAVEDKDKLIHNRVRELSQQMRDYEPATASDLSNEKCIDKDVLFQYRMMTPEGCLLPESPFSDESEREIYLDVISQWEQEDDWSYLNAEDVLNTVLPAVVAGTDAYEQEKVLVHLKLLNDEENWALQNAMERRAEERKQSCEEALKRGRASDEDSSGNENPAYSGDETSSLIQREKSASPDRFSKKRDGARAGKNVSFWRGTDEEIEIVDDSEENRSSEIPTF